MWRVLPLLALFLVSCAKQRSGPTSSATAHTLVAVRAMGSLDAAIAEVQNGGTVTCAAKDACPPSVGMLLAADAAGGLDPGSDSLLGCTTVLVAANLALTNSHCIPSAVKLLPDLCASRMKLILPAADGHPAESFSCQRLLGFSLRETATSPDLALLQLDHSTNRALFPLDRSGVPVGGILQSFRVTPDLKNRAGLLSASQCTPAPGSYRMPVYTSQGSSVFVTGDCGANPGNSGSPFLDGNGKLRGLLQADLPIPADALAQWLPHLAPPEKAFAPLNLGTSLVCLSSDPGGGVWNWNPACTSISDDDVQDARPRLHDLLVTPLFLGTALLSPFERQTPIFNWTATPLSLHVLDGEASLSPSCLRPVVEWAGLFGGNLPKSAELNLTVPRFSVSVQFNRYLQLTSPSIEIESTNRVMFSFSPQDAAQGRATISSEGKSIELVSCQ
jgi:hypothetical protein